ncbi:MAG TPA: hypothetical protein VJ183_05280 [Chloroflexia bacterium]|nr:hypothetical protein [Chloroflexia bacterium]
MGHYIHGNPGQPQNNANSQPDVVPDLKIGIIGDTQTGKTTLIGALRIAGTQQEDDFKWNIRGLDAEKPNSGAFMTTNTGLLLNQEFPTPGTVSNSEYAYLMSGKIPKARLNFIMDLLPNNDLPIVRWVRDLVQDTQSAAFKLQLWDYPGDSIRNNTGNVQDLIEFFATCDGIVFLFDPHPQYRQNSTTTLDATLDKLFNEAYIGQKLDGDFKFRQYLAVCITKFDEPYIHKELVKHRLNGTLRTGLPYPTNPETAFKVLAGDYAHGQIATNFPKGRVGYFMSSSIGIYMDAKGKYDPTKENTYPASSGVRIQCPVRPINVLEPLIWIYSSVQHERSQQPAPKNPRRWW